MKYLPRLREGCPGWVTCSLRPTYLKLAQVARGKGLVGVEVEAFCRREMEKMGDSAGGRDNNKSEDLFGNLASGETERG